MALQEHLVTGRYSGRVPVPVAQPNYYINSVLNGSIKGEIKIERQEMSMVEQQATDQIEENENGTVLSDDYLSSLTKPKLINLIKTLEDSKKKEKRQEDWGKQFDKWLIHAATKKREITFIMATAVSSSPEAIKAIPLRIDKYNIQVKCLSDDTEPWLNKNFIIYCV